MVEEREVGNGRGWGKREVVKEEEEGKVKGYPVVGVSGTEVWRKE